MNTNTPAKARWDALRADAARRYDARCAPASPRNRPWAETRKAAAKAHTEAMFGGFDRYSARWYEVALSAFETTPAPVAEPEMVAEIIEEADLPPLRVESFRVTPREARVYAALESATAVEVRPVLDVRV